MPMKRRLPPPTAEQQRRQDLARAAGCIIAHRLGLGYVPAEIHHLVDCGQTISQDHTIALNPWSHRGELWGMWTKQQCIATFGPSLAKAKRAFHMEYGSNEQLLAYQNERIGWTAAPAPRHRGKGSTSTTSKTVVHPYKAKAA